MNEPAKKHVFVIKGILKLIDSSSLEPLDTELATSALNLLYRLITRRGMVEEFMLVSGFVKFAKFKSLNIGGRN